MIDTKRRIYLYRGRCDMRRSFDRLAAMVKEEIAQDPLSGDAYVFLNGKCRMMKCLSWDMDGYVIWYKRLERGRFLMPDGDHLLINRTEWMHMLEGITVKIVSKQPRYRAGQEKTISTEEI